MVAPLVGLLAPIAGTAARVAGQAFTRRGAMARATAEMLTEEEKQLEREDLGTMELPESVYEEDLDTSVPVSQYRQILDQKGLISSWQKQNENPPKDTKAGDPVRKAIKQQAVKLNLDPTTKKVTNADQLMEFRKKVDEIEPYSIQEKVPELLSSKAIISSLKSDQRKNPIIGLDAKIKTGEEVKSRFDITSYTRFGAYHATLRGKKDGKDTLLGYAPSVYLKDVDLSDVDSALSLKISQRAITKKGQREIKEGKKTEAKADRQDKTPFITMKGKYIDHDPRKLKAYAERVFDNPEWSQLSVNPAKAGTFVRVYKEDGITKSVPVTKADEVIQIGKMVLAKGVKDYPGGWKEYYKAGNFNEGGSVEEQTKKMFDTAKQLSKQTGVKHEVDHVNPKSNGGSDDPSNLQVVTKEENLIKNSVQRGTYKPMIEKMYDPKKYPTYQKGGAVEDQTQKLLQEGGLNEEGGTVDPVSGNDVPVGSTQEEVRDDIPAQLSEGEFVFPADVVRFIGLNNLMKLRQEAKEGLGKMDRMGQMGNSEEAVEDDTGEFDTDIDSIIEEVEAEMAAQESPKDTIEESEDSDLKKKIEEGVTGFNVGGSVEKEDETNNPPTEKPETVNEQVRDYRSPFAMKRLDPSKGMPDTESSQIGRALLGKKGFTSARDIVSRKFPDIVDPTKNPNTSTKVGTSTTNKTQQTKVKKDFSTFISGPKDYTNLTDADAKSNIMNQLQHQNEYLKRQGQSYPNPKDQPFINQYMADSLAQAGIKDLRQLGYKDVEQPKVSAELIKKGDKYYLKPEKVSNHLDRSREKSKLIEVSPEDVKTTSRSLGMGGKETKIVGLVPQAPKRILINKDTGEQVVQGKYGGELGYEQDTTRAIGYGMRSKAKARTNIEAINAANDPRKGLRWGNTTQTEGMTNFMIRFDENDNALIYPEYSDTSTENLNMFAASVLAGAAATYGPGIMSKVGTKASSLGGKVTSKIGSAVTEKIKNITLEGVGKKFAKKLAEKTITDAVIPKQ